MARTDRYFEIIQILRLAKKPVLAIDIARALEVSIRTVYRDIAYLQSRQTPIYGETGIGYVMRSGYDLPPVNFDEDEAEAVFVGLSMIARTGDKGLWRAAKSASRKLREAAPGLRQLIASSWGAVAPTGVDLSDVRLAIREERKLHITYQDVKSEKSERAIWPLALIYYYDNEVIVAWCELREDVRHFRSDRIITCKNLQDHFAGQGAALFAEWEITQKAASVETQGLD